MRVPILWNGKQDKGKSRSLLRAGEIRSSPYSSSDDILSNAVHIHLTLWFRKYNGFVTVSTTPRNWPVHVIGCIKRFLTILTKTFKLMSTQQLGQLQLQFHVRQYLYFGVSWDLHGAGRLYKKWRIFLHTFIEVFTHLTYLITVTLTH
jgi:hypothetical protein